jgi:hypothetical protein
MGGLQSRSEHCGVEINHLSLLGIEPQAVRPVARCYTDWVVKLEMVTMGKLSELVTLLSRIREVAGFNLVRETGYAEVYRRFPRYLLAND